MPTPDELADLLGSRILWGWYLERTLSDLSLTVLAVGFSIAIDPVVVVVLGIDVDELLALFVERLPSCNTDCCVLFIA